MACVLEGGRAGKAEDREVRFIPREKPDREGRGMSELRRVIPPPWRGQGKAGGQGGEPSRRG